MPADRDDRLQIEADLLPPVHEDAGALEFVQHLQGNQPVFEGVEQFVAHLGHLAGAVCRRVLCILQLGEVVPGNLPPGCEGLEVGGEGVPERGSGFEDGLDGGLGLDGLAEAQVAEAFGPKQQFGMDAEAVEVAGSGLPPRLPGGRR